MTNEELVLRAQRDLRRPGHHGRCWRAQLYKQNRPWLVQRAYRFSRAAQLLDVDDLVNEGARALVGPAVDQFDHDRGTKFLTYADQWVLAYMRKALRVQDQRVRLPPVLFDLRNRWRKARGQGLSEGAFFKAEEALGHNWTDNQRRIVRCAFTRDFSLNAPVVDGEGDEWIDRMPANVQTVDLIAEKEERDAVRASLAPLRAKLDARMLVILDEYVMGEGVTLQEIGDRFGISRERARQLSVKLMCRIREALTGRPIESIPRTYKPRARER